jgi:hypothetical protein
VGVKLAITVAMQFVTFVADPQLGAPGVDGLEKPGFVPNTLAGP